MLTHSKITAEVLKWLFSVASALLVAYVVAIWTLNDRIGEGQAVFDSISIRYFAAVFALYEKPDDNGSDWQVTTDEQTRAAYREIVGDIREDIRWLRTNPLYGELIERNASLVFLQNFLVAEQVGDGAGNKNTLHFMCQSYGESSWRRDGGDDVLSDLREFAARLCMYSDSR